MSSPEKKGTRRLAVSASNSPKGRGTRKAARALTVVHGAGRLNERLVGLLEELATIEKSRGEPFKARAYKKAAESVMESQYDITSVDQMEGKPGIGTKIMAKFRQFEKEGDVDLLRRERDSPVVKLNEVHGIGPKKAKDLVEKYGIKDVAQLKQHANDYVAKDGTLVPNAEKQAGMKPLLDAKPRTGLQYFDDLMERIPRGEIDNYNKAFHAIFDKLSFPGQKLEIVGSYRRGKQNSGDIDVIVTDSDGNNELLKAFSEALAAAGIIEVFLTKGATKIMAVSRLPGEKARRLDLMFAPPQEYPFAVLYFTGSAAFNIGMRLRALEMGLSMSEHGFKDAKTKEPVLTDLKDEKSIFKTLGLVYKAPDARVNSESVVRLKSEASASTAPTSDAVAVAAVAATPAPKKKAAPKKKLEIVPATAVAAQVASSTVAKKQTRKRAIKKAPNLVVEQGARKSPKSKTLKSRSKLSVMEHIQAFKAQGAKYLEVLNQNELEAMIALSNEIYRNAASGEPTILTDPQYDMLVDILERRFPDSAVPECIGAPVERCKAKLPYPMPSMDKIKPNTGSLAKWEKKMAALAKKRGDTSAPSYVCSAKLDGVSGLYTTEGKPALYTRGDGSEGQDVSNMIPHLRLPAVKDIVVRGEFLFSKAVFAEKYQKKYANARNLVSGVVNAKKSADIGKYGDLDFVAYEVMKPVMKPSEQMDFLVQQGFNTVLNRTEKTLSNELLSELLQDWRHTYAYEIDGVIVTDDNLHKRKAQNPEYSFAFKMVLSDQLAETTVEEVIWTPSEYGYLKPKLLVTPVTIGGATIKYVTANNARFVVDNKIGVGTVILLERAGDVIPKVSKVITPSQEPQMPDVPYVWNDTHVDIMLEKPAENKAVQLRNLAGFFASIGVDGLGPGSAKKLFEAGYDTITKVVHATEEQMQGAIGKANGSKVFKSLHETLPITPMAKLMSASGILGRGMGSKRIQHALDMYPNLLTMPSGDVAAAVIKAEGFAKKSAQQLADGLPEFKAFLEGLDISPGEAAAASASASASVTAPVAKDGPLKGIKVVFSGGRHPELEKEIVAQGGDISSSVSKTTTFLVLKDVDSTSGKAKKARELGVPIVTVEGLRSQLQSQYGVETLVV